MIEKILDWWWQGERPKPNATLWYNGGPEADAYIAKHFGQTHAKAVNGELAGWKETSDGALALTIVFDQFSRQMYRGSGKAFAADSLAIATVQDSLKRGYDKVWRPTEASFGFVLPMMHQENLKTHQTLEKMLAARLQAVEATLQDETISEEAKAVAEQTKKGLEGEASFAKDHREMIAKFGRYPYRNKALGRENTAAEAEYLESLPKEKRYGQ